MLDIVMALALVLLLSMVAWPLVTAGTSLPRLNALVTDITTLLRQDRTLALRTGHEVVTTVDLDRRTVSSNRAGVVALPADVRFEILSSGLCARSAKRFVVLFRPDGTSCGAVIRIGREASAYTIRVNWLTGAIGAARE